MEETAQNFEKRFFINRSQICIALPKFYVTHRIYEILSKSLVPTVHLTSVSDFYSARVLNRVLQVYAAETIDNGEHQPMPIPYFSFHGYKIPLRNERRRGAARNNAEQVVPASNHSTAVPLYSPFINLKLVAQYRFGKKKLLWKINRYCGFTADICFV